MESRLAETKGEVEADSKGRIFSGERYGFFCRVPIHHEACGGEDTVAMRLNNRVVDA